MGSSYVPPPDFKGRILQLVQPEPAFILVTVLRWKDEIMYTSHVSRDPSEHNGTSVLMCKLINSLQGCSHVLHINEPWLWYYRDDSSLSEGPVRRKVKL